MTIKKNEIGDALSMLKKQKSQASIKTVVEVVEKNPIGRPSYKDESTPYVKLSAKIPDATKTRMKVALFTTFKDLHKTQDDFLNAAILHYIERFEGK
jgi:hypothetical protein